NALVGKIIEAIQPRLGEKHIKDYIRLKQQPLKIMGDNNYLQEAVERLVDNAIRYTPEGGTITIGTYSVRDQAVIEVTDTGPGILDHDMPHIFERFYRGQAARETRGLGLGLPIAKAIVEMHKGRIEVLNQPGEGSSFRIWLPTTV